MNATATRRMWPKGGGAVRRLLPKLVSKSPEAVQLALFGAQCLTPFRVAVLPNYLGYIDFSGSKMFF
jgi:hypothetical protein